MIIMEKCKGASRYAGKAFPRCNRGNPCKACLLKYAQVQSGLQENHTAHVSKPACSCGYDQRLAGAFDQVTMTINTNKRVAPTEDYLKALGHTSVFPAMVASIVQDESEGCQATYYVLADAVRYGIEVGRRLQSLEALEEMVGFKEGHPEIVVEPAKEKQ